MNRITIGCVLVVCLIGAISAQGPRPGSNANAAAAAALASRMGGGAAGGMFGASRGLGGMFPLIAMANGGNDALMPMMFCRSGMNLMCMMALSQGGFM